MRGRTCRKTKSPGRRPEREWAAGCCSVAQSCPPPCDPTDCSMPGFPVLLPCPPPPAVCSNSCPLSRWCHPAISSSAVPFSSCPPSFPTSGSFPVSQVFGSGGQRIGTSASASVLPLNLQGWPPLGLTGLISLLSKGTLKSLLRHPGLKASILQHSAFFGVQLSHPNMTTGKTITLTIQTFIGKVMCLLFNVLSRFITAFLPRSNHLLISWPQSPSTVILEPKKIKVCCGGGQSGG